MYSLCIIPRYQASFVVKNDLSSVSFLTAYADTELSKRLAVRKCLPLRSNGIVDANHNDDTGEIRLEGEALTVPGKQGLR